MPCPAASLHAVLMPPARPIFLAASIGLLSAPAAVAQPRSTEATFPMPAATIPAVLPSASRLHGWRGSTLVGLSSGLGSPYGLLGGFVAFFPHQRIQLEVGGGYSTGFGPSVAALGRFGVNPGNSSFLALGLGLSTSFADYRYPDNCEYPDNGAASRCTPPGAPRYVEGSASALWLNVEVSEDVRLGGRVGGRLAVGAGFLLNPGAFPTAAGCPPEGVGQSPCDVGAARSREEVSWLLHARIDLYYIIVRGDR